MGEKTIDDRKNDIRKQPSSSGFKSEIDTSIKLVPLRYCPNRAKVLKIQASLGELLRNDALACIIWKTEILKRMCCFVLLVNQNGEHGDNHFMYEVSANYENNGPQYSRSKNHPMVVEQFKNESDCHNIATSFSFEIEMKGKKNIISLN